MDKKNKQIIKISVLVFSIFLLLVFSLKFMSTYIASILANIVSNNPEIADVTTIYYQKAYDIFVPQFIFEYILISITLIAIPLCIKYKKCKSSKIISIIISVCSFIFATGFDSAFGFVYIFILIYSLIANFFVFKNKKK